MNVLLSMVFSAVWGSRGLRQEVTLMVHDDGPVGLDGVQVRFDDERVVSDAGIALVATIAERLGLEALVARCVRLRTCRPGAGNTGRKVMALIYAMALDADSIDDCDVLRAGAPAGCWAAAAGLIDAGHVSARVHVRACPPA